MGFDAGHAPFVNSFIVKRANTGVDVDAYNMNACALSWSTAPGTPASVRFATH
jgi:hypothetical protein